LKIQEILPFSCHLSKALCCLSYAGVWWLKRRLCCIWLRRWVHVALRLFVRSFSL